MTPFRDDISPHTQNALKRIESGWRINYVTDDCPQPWEVYNVAKAACDLFDTADEAKAEYLRLAAGKEGA